MSNVKIIETLNIVRNFKNWGQSDKNKHPEKLTASTVHDRRLFMP